MSLQATHHRTNGNRSLANAVRYNQIDLVKTGARQPGETRLDVQPTTPTGAAAYTVPLGAGESRTLDFRMPLTPLTPGSPEFADLESASWDAAHQATVAFWRGQIERGMQIELPEAATISDLRLSSAGTPNNSVFAALE